MCLRRPRAEVKFVESCVDIFVAGVWETMLGWRFSVHGTGGTKMKACRSISAVVCAIAACALSAPAAIAEPPAAASVQGVHNAGWGAPNCMAASFGKLLQQRDPSITPAEVVVRAAVCTQRRSAGWGQRGASLIIRAFCRWPGEWARRRHRLAPGDRGAVTPPTPLPPRETHDRERGG